MAKSKSTLRGDQFERDYLLRMGLVNPAKQASSELDELRLVERCCEVLLPVAEHGARPGNAPELVATWLKALAATSRRAIANGGMGAVAPMVTKVVASQSTPSRA